MENQKEKSCLSNTIFMKQVNEMRKPGKTYPYMNRIWLLIVLGMIMRMSPIMAQGIQWAGGTPKLNPEQLILEGESGDLELYFTARNNIPMAEVEIVLPSHFKYMGISKGDNMGSGIEFTPQSQGENLKLKVTSNGGELLSGDNFNVIIKVAAKCGAENGAEIGVKVLSGIMPVDKGDTKLPVIVQTPTIRITSPKPKIDFDHTEQEKTFELQLQTGTGSLNGVELLLEMDTYVDLSTFKLDDLDLSATTKTTNAKKVYTLSVGTLSTTSQKLTFNAKSNRPGSRTIVPKAKYFQSTACTGEQTGQLLTMVIPAQSGTPLMSHVNSSYVDDSDNNIGVFSGTYVDGITPNTVKSIFKNSGNGDAWDLSVTVNLFSLGFIDVDEIYYQVEGEEKKKLNKDESVVTKINLPGSTSYSYLHYPDHEDKPYHIRINFPSDVIVGAEKKMTLWVRTYNGKVYDNKDINIYAPSTAASVNGVAINYTCNDSQGEPGGKETLSRVIRGNFTPKFGLLPGEFTMKANQRETQKILISTPVIDNECKLRVTVKLPEWMSLDYENGIEEAILFKNAAGSAASPIANSATYENGVYSIIFSTANMNYTQDPEHYLWFNYKITGSLDENEKERKANIQYGLDYIINGYALENIGQVKQPVIFIKEEGIRLDKFSLQRTTKGLKDSNNRRMPDDGSMAPDEEINSYLYISNDEGVMNWEATVLDGNYKYFYIPFNLTGININLEEDQVTGRLNIKTDEITVKADNNPIPEEMVSVHKIGDKSFYILLEDPNSNYLNADKKIEISLPFVDRINTAVTSTFRSECFVSNNAVSTPGNSSDNPDRKGKDAISFEVRLVYPQLLFYWNNDSHYANFYSDETVSITGGWQNMFHNILPSPYFKDEYRCHAYPYQMIWEMPEGYTIIGGITITRGSNDGQGPATQTLYPDPDLSSGNIYVFDMESLYDLEYDGSPGTTLKEGKWILPDDRWHQTNTLTIKPSKAAASVSTLKRSYIAKNPNTGEVYPTIEKDVTFNYLGTTISIEPSVKKMTAYSSKVNIPNINLANTSPEEFIHQLWLYIDGNVSNPEISGADGVVRGEGFENRWIKLNGKMKGSTALDFSLDFDFTGIDEDITVYTVCGFDNENWIAPVNSNLNTSSNPNLGAQCAIRITMADAALSGTLKVSDPDMEHLQPYTLTVTVDGTQSEGIVRNPKVNLTIPAGQHYISGTARFTYDQISGFSALLEEAFKAGNDDANPQSPEPLERTIEIDLSTIAGREIVFPGFLSIDPSDTDAKRIAVIEAQFAPMCNSELTGMRFNGRISGENARGDAAAGYKIISPSLLPALQTEYDFEVNMTFADNTYAFNEWQKSDVLTVTLRKITGADIPMQESDYLLLEMPALMDITGNITQNSVITGISGQATVESNTVSPVGDTRGIIISLPVDKINGDGNLGQNKDIVFTIPVTYSPEEKALANDPLHRLEAKVVSSAAFGSCGEKSFTIGESVTHIAILTIEKTDYTTFIGSPLIIKMLDNSLKGKWYINEDLSDEGTEGATFTYTPQPTEFPDKNALADGVEKTLWVSALFPDADDPQIINDYGKVPVKITVYPTLAFDVMPQNTICGSATRTYSELVNELTVPVGTEVSLYTSEDCQESGKITTWPYTVSSSQSIWACASNKGGKGQPKEIQFTVNETPAIQTDLVEETVYLDHGAKTTLHISATGDNITYEWYKKLSGENVFERITGQNSTSLEVSESGEYYALVIGCEVIQSKTTTIVICPLLSITVNGSMPVVYCETDQTLLDGISLKSYIENINSEFDYLYLNGNQYEEITDDVILSTLPGETTYSMVAENKAGSRTQPLTLNIKVDRIFSITQHPQHVQIYSGNSATLTVVADVSNMTYQWQKRGSDQQFANITDATASSYSVSEQGEYRVLVTGVTAGCGSRTIESYTAKVTVVNPPLVEDEIYRITYEANWGSKVNVTIYQNNRSVSSGDYVDKYTRILVTVTPGMAGLKLESLTANGQEISERQIISVEEDVHIVAVFELDNSDPNPGVGNVEINDPVVIRSGKGILYVDNSNSGNLRIFDVEGKLITERLMTGGETSIPLPQGVYVVVINNKEIHKVIIK